MSGHSKWSNIKRKKGAADAARANIFSKIGKEITVAVKMGKSGDQNVNSRLKDAISKAKANNMPSDNIKRCIDKAIGDGTGGNFEDIVYEGFGPFSVSVIVEANTDNKNRTAADIRCIFDRAGGSMGQTGSVGYMFEKKGVIIIEKQENFKIDEDELMLEVIELGAEEFNSYDTVIEILIDPKDFKAVEEYIESKNLSIVESEIKMISNITKELTEEEKIKFETFVEKLEENDDVQSVWHNAEI